VCWVYGLLLPFSCMSYNILVVIDALHEYQRCTVHVHTEVLQLAMPSAIQQNVGLHTLTCLVLHVLPRPLSDVMLRCPYWLFVYVGSKRPGISQVITHDLQWL
jgi:hypothetical protein